MKYAFMTFSTPQLALDEVLRTAKAFGYDGVEFRLDAKHNHGVEVTASQADRAEMREEIVESGIAPCCLATSLKFANPSDEADAVSQAHDRIDLAGDMGAHAMRVFGGAVPPGLARDKAIDQMVKCLTAIADHAAKRHVAVCLETHDDWCNPEHVAAVLAKVNHPAIACNWDVMHPVRMKFATVDQSFEILKPWIRHTHLHDGVSGPPLKMVPIGTGEIDHRAFVKCLKSINYKGFLSGEWINWEPFEIHLPRELATLKKFEAEA